MRGFVNIFSTSEGELTERGNDGPIAGLLDVIMLNTIVTVAESLIFFFKQTLEGVQGEAVKGRRKLRNE